MASKMVKYFVVDAFTESPFKGNPAAVCLLEDHRDDDWLQAVALEFNISETCYLTNITTPGPDSDATSNPRFRLRWFTPVAEVELCGHATLAAAHALFSSILVDASAIEFDTLSGILTARKVPDIKISNSTFQSDSAQESFSVELDFLSLATIEYSPADISSISEALNGLSIIDIKKKVVEDDLLVVLSSGEAVAQFQPQFDKIEKCPSRGMIITGFAPPDSGFDFYSRYFCPKLGINEDPVTGSAHCALATYWSGKLGKCDFVAYQASPRGGMLKLHLDDQNQRVLLQGTAVTVMEGSLLV